MNNLSIIKKRHQFITNWLQFIVKEIKENDQFEVSEKSSRKDLVTSLDQRIEQYLTKQIRREFPGDHIISEEGYGDDLEDLSGTVWFIDPIDGTLNFVKQRKNFCVMVAVYEEGQGIQSYIYDISHDRLYWAVKGEGAFCNDMKLPALVKSQLQDSLLACNSNFISGPAYNQHKQIFQEAVGLRMIGSAGLEAVEVALGRNGAYLATKLMPWDFAAGKIIVEELGGVLCKVDGEPVNLFEPSSVMIANKGVYSELLDHLNNR